jgi:aspartate carbamoyltransferase
MLRLGGSVMDICGDNNTSLVKGESAIDTVRTMCSYSNVLVIRHPEKGMVAHLAQHALNNVPVINAGDGTGEHPTQALLDLFTILDNCPEEGDEQPWQNPVTNKIHTSKLTILFLGDLKNSRTVHSLVRLLALYPFMIFLFVSPQELQMPEHLVAEISHVPHQHYFLSDLEDVVQRADVLYVTRLQKERYATVSETTEIESWRVNRALLEKAKPNMIVMHPLPRNNELATDVDVDPRAKYFEQMTNGMYVRMAILYVLLAPSEKEEEKTKT